MKIYLASRYSRHIELQEIAKVLISHGHEITSRWLWGNHQIDDNGLSIDAKRSVRERFAKEDYADLMEAEIVISFTEVPRSSNSRGGRHVEFGVALASQKRCIIIGPRENVFHCLPEIEVVESIWGVKDLIK